MFHVALSQLRPADIIMWNSYVPTTGGWVRYCAMIWKVERYALDDLSLGIQHHVKYHILFQGNSDSYITDTSLGGWAHTKQLTLRIWRDGKCVFRGAQDGTP